MFYLEYFIIVHFFDLLTQLPVDILIIIIIIFTQLNYHCILVTYLIIYLFIILDYLIVLYILYYNI